MTSPVPNSSNAASNPRQAGWLAQLGPGLITGAADDDPSGIATYSQAGARFGYALLWTALFTIPLMSAIQEISARLGRITGRGLAGNMRQHYSPWLLYPVVSLLAIANLLNLAADIGAMGQAAALVLGGWPALYAIVLASVSLVLQVFFSYKRYANLLKWLTLALFAYPLTAFCVHIPWRKALLATVRPELHWSGHYFAAFLAVLGTTISPYLFFWQAAMETEEIRCSPAEDPLKEQPRQARTQFRRIRLDTIVGMTMSNVIAFFIMLVAAATLYSAGVHDVDTAEQAARALEPLAGRFAFVLFSLGIIGGGMLAIPALAGSAAYAVSETFNWRTGLNRLLRRAPEFYAVLGLGVVLGVALNFTPLDPIRALFWSAVVNGVVAVPVMIVMMLMVSNPRVVEKFTLVSRGLRLMGWLATLVMLLATIGLFATWTQ